MLKNTLQLDYMRKSGKLVADVFNHLKTVIKPGVTGLEIDAIVEEMIFSRGGRPAFKNYTPHPDMSPFPYSICWSMNEEVIHGFPSNIQVKNGDVISVDMGVDLNGYYGDSAYTFLIGDVDPEVRKMSDCTKKLFGKQYRFVNQVIILVILVKQQNSQLTKNMVS